MNRAEQRHIFAALAISAALHLLLLWQLPPSLPEDDPDLPPLQARLEPLPAPTPSLKPVKPKRSRAAPPSAPMPAIEGSDADAPNAAPGTPSPDLPTTVEAPPPVVATAAPAEEPPPLPRRAMLKFDVRLGESGMVIGEVRHYLEIENGRYAMRGEIRTVGLARLFKYVSYNQISHGTTSSAGFRPDYAQEDKNLDGSLQKAEIFFDHTGGTLRFSLGGESSLPEDTQDRLSLLYQLSRLPLSAETLPLAVTDGRKLEKYRVRIGPEEEILTPLGKLRTLPIRKITSPGEEGLEVWLALEYRLLPVKVIRLDRNGSANGVMLIKEILLEDAQQPDSPSSTQ